MRSEPQLSSGCAQPRGSPSSLKAEEGELTGIMIPCSPPGHHEHGPDDVASAGHWQNDLHTDTGEGPVSVCYEPFDIHGTVAQNNLTDGTASPRHRTHMIHFARGTITVRLGGFGLLTTTAGSARNRFGDSG